MREGSGRSTREGTRDLQMGKRLYGATKRLRTTSTGGSSRLLPEGSQEARDQLAGCYQGYSVALV